MTERPRVLLVEDNWITIKLVRFILAKEHLQLDEAIDGASALQQIDRAMPDLILMDLQLPDMSGFDLVARVRSQERSADVPVLAFSGLLPHIDEARFAAAGFTGLITKPVDPSHLARLVRSFLSPSAEGARPVGRGRRILLVDDDALQRKLTAFRLSRFDFTVDQAASAEEALAATKRARPDALVSDIHMPGMDGYALTAAVRRAESTRDLPVVLMTSTYIEDGDREFSRKVGADAFIVRTPDFEELTATLARILDAGSRRRSHLVPAENVIQQRGELALVQLERQIALRTELARQCSMLSAQLAVLTAITDAVGQVDDLESVLREALALCLDAGAISVGALYLFSGTDGWRTLPVGRYDCWQDGDLDGFFGQPDVLREIVHAGTPWALRAETDDARVRNVISRAGVASMLVVPLVPSIGARGALVMFSRGFDLADEGRLPFAQAVAGQIGVALALTRAFREREASERSAVSQATLLQSVFASMGEAVVVTEGGKVTKWNTAASDLLGLTADHRDLPLSALPETVGFFRPDRVTPLPSLEAPLRRATTGQPVTNQEVFLKNATHQDGAWVEVTATPLHDNAGGTYGSVGIFRDITAERQAQEHLVMSDRLASIGMLSASIGHEINNPLAAVVGYLELAAEGLAVLAQDHPGVDLGDLPGQLAGAREGAERVRQIVRDLRVFSRGEAEHSGAVGVEPLLESSIRMAWNEIRHRARVVRDYHPVPPVAAPESQLGQVFLNLIVNAAQAIPAGHASENEIRVSVRPDAGGVRIEIADSGQGIPDDILSRLFRPFVSSKPVGIGTGLGLAICHRLVTGMKGTIAVTTEQGRGSTFSVVLPAAAADTAKPAPPPVAHRAPSRSGRLLVIDDDPSIGMMVARVLRPQHHVMVTVTAAEAIALIQAGERFDLILCDIMMPLVTGMDFYRQLSEIEPAQARAVVFLTGGAFTLDTQTFIDQMRLRTLAKPFAVRELRSAVDDWLRDLAALS